LALLEDPFDPKLLDVIIFDALPHMDISGEGQISLAKEIKERNPLHFGFQVPFALKKILCLFCLITFSSLKVLGALNNFALQYLKHLSQARILFYTTTVQVRVISVSNLGAYFLFTGHLILPSLVKVFCLMFLEFY